MLGVSISMGLGQQALSSGGATATTWNPANSSTDWTFSGGNLSAIRNVTTAGFWAMLRATAAKTNGTFITTVNALGTGAPVVCSIGFDTGAETQFPGQAISGISIGYESSGSILQGNQVVATGAAYTTGDIIKVVKSGVNVSFYKNNVLQATVDTSNPANGFGTVLAGNAFPAASNGNGTGTSLTGDFSAF